MNIKFARTRGEWEVIRNIADASTKNAHHNGCLSGLITNQLYRAFAAMEKSGKLPIGDEIAVTKEYFTYTIPPDLLPQVKALSRKYKISLATVIDRLAIQPFFNGE